MFSRNKSQQQNSGASLAQALDHLHEPDRWAFVPDDGLARTLTEACKLVGDAQGQRYVQGMAALYRYAADILPVNARQAAVTEVGDIIMREQTTVDALLPALSFDPSNPVVASAAMLHAQLYQPVGNANGVDSLVYLATAMGASQRVGIAIGLYLLGDRRALPSLIEVWNTLLDDDGRETLLGANSGFTAAATVAFVLNVLENLDDDDPLFGAAVAALVRLAEKAEGGVVREVQRAMPIRQGAPMIAYPEQWGIQEYGERFMGRLYDVWQRESEPKIVQHAASAWGYTFE